MREHAETVYSFAPDTPAVSRFYGSCAAYWPPVTGPAASPGLPGRIGTIKRTDGTDQLTYNGHPLYTYNGITTAAAERLLSPLTRHPRNA